MAKVICEICGKEISLNNIKKHLQSHESHPEYHMSKMQHVTHDGLNCIYCGKLCKNKNSLAQHECRCKENPNRYKILNNFKVYNTKSHSAWNKGLTKETDERVRRNGEAVKASFLNENRKVLYGDDNPSRRKEVREKISNTCLEKSKNGEWHTSLAKNLHFNYKGIDLHGSWEVAYAEYLDLNNISWIRCKDRFEYTFEGAVHYYTPDFYLVESDTYVEIKGYKTKKDEAKWKQFPVTKTLKVLKKKDLQNLGISIKV